MGGGVVDARGGGVGNDAVIIDSRGNDAVVIDRRSGSDAEGGRREVSVSAPSDDPSRITFNTTATPPPPTSTLGKAKGCEIVVSSLLGEAPTANRVGDNMALEVPGAAAKAKGANTALEVPGAAAKDKGTGKNIGSPAIASWNDKILSNPDGTPDIMGCYVHCNICNKDLAMKRPFEEFNWMSHLSNNKHVSNKAASENTIRLQRKNNGDTR